MGPGRLEAVRHLIEDVRSTEEGEQIVPDELHCPRSLRSRLVPPSLFLPGRRLNVRKMFTRLPMSTFCEQTMFTKRQHQTLALIRQHIARTGEAPSLAEIAAGTGIRSRAAAHRHVKALADAGCIELVPGRKRGIRLVGDAAEGLLELPLAGRIAAGRPIEAIPGRDTLNLADFFLGPDRFALQVRGDSMIGAGILNGDTVVVQRTAAARDRDIVVALIDRDEATLKRIKYGKGSVTLIPENPDMEPVVYDDSRIAVQGVVVGQMRSYR